VFTVKAQAVLAVLGVIPPLAAEVDRVEVLAVLQVMALFMPPQLVVTVVVVFAHFMGMVLAAAVQ
jgi:hypothetical protein